MPRTVIRGLNARVLADYLAQIGLAAVLATQADPQLRFGWEGTRLWVDTTVDVVDFLLREYQPSPIMSPWNGSSGFNQGDKKPKVTLDKIMAADETRLVRYQSSARVALRLTEERERKAWDKPRFIQELRNQLPEEALDWMDAAVVLRGSAKPEFPPLLGSGGNDGRLEFSVNFRDQLLRALPELGALESRSSGWLRDLVEGTAEQRLTRAPFGMYDGTRAASPNTTRTDQSGATANPWVFILMMEGLAKFASGVSRRQGRWAGKAAMPFTVHAGQGEDSAERPVGGSRGEFWAPLMRSATWSSFSRTVQQSRASWDGGRAVAVPQMYAALRSYGVDRGIDAFERFVFNQANGKAYVAVLADVVEVHEDPAIGLARIPMGRLNVLRRASGAAAQQQARRLTSRVTKFTRTPSPDALLTMLAQLTTAELVCRRSMANREAVRPAGELLPASEVLAYLNSALSGSPELRLAAGLASARILARRERWSGDSSDESRPTRTVALRDLVVGAGQEPPVITGLTERPLPDVLADVAVWVSHHAPTPVGAVGQILVNGHGYRAPAADAHRWVCEPESLDAGLLRTAFLAFLAVNWKGAVVKPMTSDERTPQRPLLAYSPELAVLAPFARGAVWAVGSTAETPRHRGADPSWASRLRAGKVAPVAADAVAVANRSYAPSYDGTPPKHLVVPSFVPTSTDGPLLLAAMLSAPLSITHFVPKENR